MYKDLDSAQRSTPLRTIIPAASDIKLIEAREHLAYNAWIAAAAALNSARQIERRCYQNWLETCQQVDELTCAPLRY